MKKRFFQNDWDEVLSNQFTQVYYERLRTFLINEYRTQTIYPPMEELWTAFRLTPYQDVKVVMIGQDPYHGPNQAHGLSFSVKPTAKIPPSLQNMFKELVDDIGCAYPENGDLTGWAEQGVLLLNTVLTVRHGQAHSHKNKGWEQFTNAVIRHLSAHDERLVFILWGGAAREKKAFIDQSKHAIVESVHPSPLSAYRGFFGSKPYSRANKYLTQWDKKTINWCQTNGQA